MLVVFEKHSSSRMSRVPSTKSRQGLHRAVGAEAAQAGTQDGAADSCGNASSHVHDAGAGVVNGAGAE